MFVKEINEPSEKPKKPKRKLTEKQLEGLAKGRAKMAEKRAMKKKMTEKKKELQNLDMKATQENQSTHKKDRQNKKEAVKKSYEIEEDFKEKKAKANKSLNKFNKLKMGALDKIKSTKEMLEFEKIMKGVNNDMAKNPEKLYTYLREHADRLAPEKQRKAYMDRDIKNSKGKKSPKRKIAEQSQEKKPNITLTIEDNE